MKISHKVFNFPFVHPFTISKGTKTHQPSFIVELEYFGVKGYGEAPAISYYNIPVDKMISDLELKRNFLEKFSFSDPERYWHYLHHLFPNNSFLVCALDMAGWDLYGKLRKQPLYKLWGLDISNAPFTDYTIGIDSIGKMIDKIKEKPWPIYKVKMGMQDDIAILSELRKHTQAIFRVDVNEGWNLQEAISKIPELEKLGVQLVEQPLPKTSGEEMKTLMEFSSLPLIADESCVYEQDVSLCKDYFNGINIKLTKCGGITPARRMMQKAREYGMNVMIGCMNESAVGTAAIAHLAPLADFADLDGPLLLSGDIAKGVEFDNGRIVYPDGNGLGITMENF